MWILIWEGQPSYWLCGDATYTIGRKGTDVLIQDDPSISRVHVSLVVGLPALVERGGPTSFVVKESSKYGTKIIFDPALCGQQGNQKPSALSPGGLMVAPALEEVTPTNNEPWAAPSGLKEFRICLGTHGAAFDVKWEPMPFFLSQIPKDQRLKFEQNVRVCGGHEVKKVEEAVAVVVESLAPTPHTVAALCCAKPIIDVGFFERTRTRLSPKVPLAQFNNTQSLPSNIHPGWKNITGQDDFPVQGFLPNRERCELFSGLTMVCFQRALFDELSVYVGHAKGHILFDSLPEPSDTRNYDDALRAFVVRHARHVVVYTELAALDTRALDRIKEESKHLLRSSAAGPSSATAGGLLVMRQYHEVIRSIIFAKRLDIVFAETTMTALNDASSDGATRRSGGGAVLKRNRSLADEQQLLGESTMLELAGVSNFEGTAMEPFRKRNKSEGRSTAVGVDEEHEPSSIAPSDATTAAPPQQHNADKIIVQELIMRGPVKLPNLPCFSVQHHDPSVNKGPQKVFKKQRLARQDPLVELEAVGPVANLDAATGGGGPQLMGFGASSSGAAHSRRPAIGNIEADDILPTNVDFDDFDKLDRNAGAPRGRAGTLAQAPKAKRAPAAAARTKSPAKPRATKKASAATAAAAVSAVRAMEDDDDVILVDLAAAAEAAKPKPGLNIFDIDNLY